MIERLVDVSVRHRFLVILLVLVVGALGVRAARELPIDAVPDVTNVQVQVLTDAPSLGPLEVEQLVTFPVESAMSGLPQLEEVRSVSRFGLSAVTLVFEEGTDLYFARQLVEERLAAAREAIPEVYGSPELGPPSTGLGEIYQFEVRGERMCPDGEDTDDCTTAMELRTVLDWFIAYQLRSVPGVVEVNAFGGELKTYEVRPDPARMRALGLGLGALLDALDRNNLSGGGGYVAHAGEQRLVRAEGRIRGLEDIRRVVVETRGGTPIRIGDVAEVVNAPRIRQGAATRDGRGEVVTGTVMMLVGESSRRVARDVDARIEELRPTLPDGVTIETYYDRTELVDRTIRTAVTNLIEGGVLVVVILLLLLGNVRGGLLVASVIPLSMLAALIGMHAAGVSGNLMSLGALDFGIIVDGAVVVVEQIVTALGRRPPGEPIRRTIAESARTVARPVTFAVAIIMLVYVPVLTLEGIEGKMFRPMAWTVLFALGASVLLALTLMPAAATVVFRGAVKEEETWLMRGLRRAYEPALDATLRRGWIPALAALIVLVAAGLLVPTLGAEFVPRLDEGAIAIQAVRLPSVSLEESVRATTRVERVLLERFPDEIETVVSKTGRPEIATDPMGVETSDIYVMLKPVDGWTRASTKEELVGAIEAALDEEVPGQNYLFSQPIELRTNELISGVRADVAVLVYGEDLDELDRIAEDMVGVLREVPGAADVSREQLSGLPLLDVTVDRDALARYGVAAEEVVEVVSTIAGRPAGTVFEGPRRFAIQVRLPPALRDDPRRIRDLPVARPGGGTVPLGQLARIRTVEGPATIGREAIQRRMTLQVNVRGRDLAGFVDEARRRVADEVDMPPGYIARWGGQFENLEAASERLLFAVPLALALIFALLYLTYGGARPALLVYLNVPFAATGGVIALVLRGMPFSISAGVGFIALFGIAVLNGVVLVSTIRDLQREGAARLDAVREGARRRLRPVLMTALTDALGFAPMALSTSAGVEVQRPLATVVIGGLITCTALTLFVLPVIYARLGGDVAGDDPSTSPDAARERADDA